MATRRQDPEHREFRQNAFASSAEFERGILGNLVAARCHKLTDPEEIAMLWWLQQVSWREGGLEKFAAEFLAGAPVCVRVPTLGSDDEMFELGPYAFADGLRRALVDPASRSLRDGMIGISDLWSVLSRTRDKEIDSAKAHLVETAITRQIGEELDFALETRSFILIEGREGIGKSEAARCWCEQHPGRAVYVRLESGLDETTLYRSIARRIGTACSYTRKAVEMRARIQDSLQGGHVMLVLDEAHTLWPDSTRFDRTVPRRMDWVRTALVDFGVPVALISTPQHFEKKCAGYRAAGWNANQIQRRLARTVTLPERLDAKDTRAVARSYFPAAPAPLLNRAATAAGLHVARLTMFSHLRKRVDFFASRHIGATDDERLEMALAEFGAPRAVPCTERATAVASTLQACRSSSAQVPGVETPANRLSASIQQFEAREV